MNGWVADEHDRRGGETSYGDEMGGSDYTYSNELAYERSRGAKESDSADAEWPKGRKHMERERHRDQRERDWVGEKDDDWEREKPGTREDKKLRAFGQGRRKGEPTLTI